MSGDIEEQAKAAFEELGKTIGDQIGNLSSIAIFQLRAMTLIKEILIKESNLTKESKLKISEVSDLIDGSIELLEQNTNKETIDIVKRFVRGENE